MAGILSFLVYIFFTLRYDSQPEEFAEFIQRSDLLFRVLMVLLYGFSFEIKDFTAVGNFGTDSLSAEVFRVLLF